MWKFIGVLSFLGIPILIVMALLNFFKKTGKAKQFFKYAAISFALFVLAVAMDPATPQNNSTTNQEKPKTEQTAPVKESTTEKSPGSASQASTNPSEKRANNTSFPIHLLASTVTSVVDGDTIEVNVNNKTEKVRLIGVDTPETKHPSKPVQPYGPEASQFTTSQLEGKKVFLETDVTDRDKYGRLLAYIWISPPKSISNSEIRSKMFNATLLLGGYAQVMTIPPNVKYVDYFTKYQTEARDGNKGLWGINNSAASSVTPSSSVSPSIVDSTPVGEFFVGSVDSDKYHYSDCRWAKKISPSNLIKFKTPAEARKAGYKPCKVCSPP